MPVFVTARGDASRPVCDGGVERREAFVKKYNLSYDDPIDLRNVLEEYGVNDTLFLLGVPEKGYEQQAKHALQEYGSWLAQGALIAAEELCVEPSMHQIVTHALAKRFNDIEHKGLLATAHARAQEWKASMTLPEHKALIEILVRLTLVDNPLHDYVTKADQALSEWAVMNKVEKEASKERREILSSLIQ